MVIAESRTEIGDAQLPFSITNIVLGATSYVKWNKNLLLVSVNNYDMGTEMVRGRTYFAII